MSARRHASSTARCTHPRVYRHLLVGVVPLEGAEVAGHLHALVHVLHDALGLEHLRGGKDVDLSWRQALAGAGHARTVLTNADRIDHWVSLQQKGAGQRRRTTTRSPLQPLLPATAAPAAAHHVEFVGLHGLWKHRCRC